MDKSKIYGISLMILSLFCVAALTVWLFADGPNDVQADRQTGIRLSIETTSTSSVTILTHGMAGKDGAVSWGEIYVPEAGYIAVESVRLPMPPEVPKLPIKEEVDE